MKSPKMPAPPDPNQVAGAQTGTNIGTAIANTASGQVNQITPEGSLSYSQRGTYKYTDPNSGEVHDIPLWQAQTQLSPDQQQIHDIGQQTEKNIATIGRDQSSRIGGVLSQPMNTRGLPSPGHIPNVGQHSRFDGGPNLDGRYASGGAITRSYGTDFSRDRQHVEDALMQRMQPHIERDRAAMETQLANQGIGHGSAARSAAVSDFGRQTNDARLGAILGAGEEQSRMVGMERDRAGFQNSAQQQAFGQDRTNIDTRNLTLQQMHDNRQQATGLNNAVQDTRFAQGQSRFGMQQGAREQALQERFAVRNQPINEITALLSGSQVSMPNFGVAQPSQSPTTDYAGIVSDNYGQRMNAWQQKNASRQSMLGGLFGLGGALGSAAIMSDRRTKTDIKKVGSVKGQPLYEFRYKGQPDKQIGLMAQDVEKKKPEAVSILGGIKHVDYGKALGVS